MITLEHLFLYYLLVFVAVFAGISGIVLAGRGIFYAKRLGGDGDVAGAKLRTAIATLLTSSSATSGFAEPSFPLCALLGCIILVTALNAWLACSDASMLVDRRYTQYALFVTSGHAQDAEPPVTPDRMGLPLFFLEESYEERFPMENTK